MRLVANPRKLGLVNRQGIGIYGDARAAAIDQLTRLKSGNRAIAAHGTQLPPARWCRGWHL